MAKLKKLLWHNTYTVKGNIKPGEVIMQPCTSYNALMSADKMFLTLNCGFSY